MSVVKSYAREKYPLKPISAGFANISDSDKRAGLVPFKRYMYNESTQLKFSALLLYLQSGGINIARSVDVVK